MKSLFPIIAILMVIINLSIPSTFQDMSAFSSGASISLNDFVESDEYNHDEEKEEKKVELEEVEKEIVLTASTSNFSSKAKSNNIHHSLKFFLSSYIFSIFIPPSQLF